MIIIDKRAKQSTFTFGTLSIGEVFIDEDKHICIKLNEGRALYYIEQNDSWKITTKDSDDEITVVKATLTIEDI